MTAKTVPGVALESTLIAHGLPWPDNFETARASEAAVRAAGAEPFTMAVLDGAIRVGLNPSELEFFAQTGAGNIIKAGRRDLAAAIAQKRHAALTVSGTLFAARGAGLNIMATGGLGGVHRGNATFDISNDLHELARADGMVVVCSGVKSILDIAATLEVLETWGVTVVGYGTDEFPAFTTVSSGLPIDTRIDGPDEAADLILAHRRLNLPGAIVIAQPPPDDLALPREEVERAIGDAIRHAEVRGISGKAITPFLLESIRKSTEGRSLIVNKALIVRNAGLAGAIAVAVAERKSSG